MLHIEVVIPALSVHKVVLMIVLHKLVKYRHQNLLDCLSHDGVFSTDYGDKLQIKHSGNRNVYAVEVLNIAKWFYQKPKNLYYMQTLIEDLHE